MAAAGLRPRSVVSLLPGAGAWAGAALALALLWTVAFLPAPLPPLTIALLGLAALTAWRLDWGLMVFALAVPLARIAVRPWAPAAAVPEMLAVAVIAGWFCRRALAADRRPNALDPPIAAAAALVIASLVVVTTLARWRLTGALISTSWLTAYLHGYFLMESSGDAIDTAMRLLETLVLFRVAATVAEESPAGARPVVAALAAGAAAAALVNLGAMWAWAPAPRFSAAAFVHEFLTARVSAHYSDLNAAGSYFVMMLPAAIGLAPGSRARAWWIAAAAIVAGGLWISGSRTAIMAGLVAMVLPIVVRGGRRRPSAVRRRHVAIAAVVLLAASAAAAAFLLPHRGTQRSAGDAARVRVELSLTAVRMLGSAPLFGVGVGNFFNLSGQFASKELLALFPPAQQENAHNYYLQVLAELGLSGFAAYAWLAWIAARRAARGFRDGAAAAWHWGAAVGVIAFALTCLGGHPLLIDEPAFSFALLAGILVGCGSRVPSPSAIAASGHGTRWGKGQRVAAAIVVAIVATIPLRWYSGRASMDLGDLAFGLTGWYTGRDGVPYRLAGRTSRIYLPAGYTAINIPIRATEPHGEVDVVFRVDGGTIEQMRIRTGAWQVVRLTLPKPSSWVRPSRFRPLDLEVLTPALTPRVLFIGRITPY